ncbi:MAG: peptide ABC transporter substrate-binding protein [Deltaproteobacteria bacterium RBG_16_49_23]|nr:MAG: peptide ABC transporter substrate-binding protein [Deltaproteobacteria bacterium RBG_16_49_23]
MSEELIFHGEHLLDVQRLKKFFPIKKGVFRRTVGWVQAVDGVSLHVDKGETLGLVGESGCGKSTTGKCILRLLEPTEGDILLEGKNISAINPSEMKQFRRKVQAVFQDPYSSLNPRMSVGNIVGEPFKVHDIHPSSDIRERVADLFKKVGLRPEYMSRYPHEFSGGQRQRIGIARSIALRPDLIIFDEPVSALDVSIQAQVINLLDDLKQEFKLSYLFIAHDLSVVEHVSDRIAVMYLGKIVEVAKDTELYSNPLHPYTRALLSAIPIPEPKQKKKRIILQGEVPSPINPPSGCRFHPRCSEAMKICKHEEPIMSAIDHHHQVSCFLYR